MPPQSYWMKPSWLTMLPKFYNSCTGCLWAAEQSFEVMCLTHKACKSTRKYQQHASKVAHTIYQHGRKLRSSQNVTRLAVPRTDRRVVDPAFLVYAPWHWNILPQDLTETLEWWPKMNYETFERFLKIILFSRLWSGSTLWSCCLFCEIGLEFNILVTLVLYIACIEFIELCIDFIVCCCAL